MKTYEEFRALAKSVRDAQKQYFKERTQANLMESKRLERLLDTELATPMPEPNLFDAGEEVEIPSLRSEEYPQRQAWCETIAVRMGWEHSARRWWRGPDRYLYVSCPIYWRDRQACQEAWNAIVGNQTFDIPMPINLLEATCFLYQKIKAQEAVKHSQQMATTGDVDGDILESMVEEEREF